MTSPIVLFNCYPDAKYGKHYSSPYPNEFSLAKNYVSSKIFLLRETKIKAEMKHLSP